MSSSRTRNFKLKQDGVYVFLPALNPNTKGVWKKLCDPIRVVASIRDENNSNWGLALEWHDFDQILHVWHVSRSLLMKPRDLAESLFLGGLRLERGSADDIAEYLNIQTPYKRLRSTTRTGWHQDVFVLPNQVFSSDGGSEYYYASPKRDHLYNVKGTLAEWKDEVGARAVGNAWLVLAISNALAGAALELTGIESGGIHIYGTTSIGKTTLGLVAGSVWGGGGPNGFIRPWRSTANALELTAAEHNDTSLTLDEIGQLDPKSAVEVPYLLANGQSKMRMNPDGTPAPIARWRLTFLSTGELPFHQVVKKGGDKTRGGMEVRLLNLPADAKKGFGVFEVLHECPTAKEFATILAVKSRQHYGVLGRSWLSHLVENRPLAQEYLFDAIKEFEGKYTKTHASSEETRVIRRFALLAACGELATNANLTGWKRGEATNASAKCLEAWISSREANA